MKIGKRDKQLQEFNEDKIRNAVLKAFASTQSVVLEEHLASICQDIFEMVSAAYDQGNITTVEEIQDRVEEELMRFQYFKEAKNYILYREVRKQRREIIGQFQSLISEDGIIRLLKELQNEFSDCPMQSLYSKYQSYHTPQMSAEEILDVLMRCCVELISVEAPKWELIAARFLMKKIGLMVDRAWEREEAGTFYEKIRWMSREGYYGSYILENYSEEDVSELERYLKEENDRLFTYSGLDLLMKRYLIRSYDHRILEKPQEMFMGIAMHLAIPEKENRVFWAKEIYDVLSALKATMATPTMANSRKPYHQMSSCFIDTVEDSLDGIYKILQRSASMAEAWGFTLGKSEPAVLTSAAFRGLREASSVGSSWSTIQRPLWISWASARARWLSISMYGIKIFRNSWLFARTTETTGKRLMMSFPPSAIQTCSGRW